MKNILICLLCVVFAFFSFFFINWTGIKTEYRFSEGDFLRIHIRANSNEEKDQLVKYRVKNEVVKFLTPKLASIESKEKAIECVLKNTIAIESVINETLLKNDFSYTGKVKIRNEYFPTRKYDDVCLEAGFYDAVIIELGEHVGNNWWCVMYPPLCFKNTENVVYKSRILEIIKQFFERR